MVSKVAPDRSLWQQTREAAEADLVAFISLVHKNRVLGNIHREVIQWWNRDEAKSHQLLLLPRDHAKSALAAYRCAHAITRNPAVRILYISSTANLAEKQLGFIKDILDSDVYRYYWPEMLNPDVGKRRKWTESEISVDHPSRTAENVRDPTVFTAGLTTAITGLHCDIAVLDDVVTYENAYTEDGRQKVLQQYGLLSSIEGADSKEWVVGTRYHPNDLYNAMLESTVEIFSPDGDIEDSYPLYEVFQKEVEDRGDGTGQFLWPRQQRYDGRWFGFDTKILARKKAQYKDLVQFRAQYYNDPHATSTSVIASEDFQHYEPSCLKQFDGQWYYKDTRLNVFAGIDFAFSTRKTADFTSIVVVGIDCHQNYYVLDIARFKTDRIAEYFKHILALHQKWGFNKLRAEITAAQSIIVGDLKQNYIRPYGLALSIDPHRPGRSEGSKEERIAAALNARYQNHQMWHYPAGNCQLLEEELMLANPPHDDIKDCLASVMDICVAPTLNRLRRTVEWTQPVSRFGGF
jgi:hypothetical protein